MPEKTPVRYKYIHIWASEEKLRAKCTDPTTLEMIIRAIQQSVESGALQAMDIARHRDISDIMHVIEIRGLEPVTEYRRLAWWMFRALCDQGWEPMDTSERSYKLKIVEALLPPEDDLLRPTRLPPD